MASMPSMASMASSRGSPGQWSQPSTTAGTPRDGTPEVNFDSSMVGPDSTHGSKRKSRASTAAAGATAGGGSFPVVGKIRHLKKEDGEPLWRRDIQYDFLRAVFDNETQVFTNSYEPGNSEKQSFADLYIDTMARSSKTSKVLRDKLLSDREAAKGMAMVCLLVNVGRMNTTLNFFPEMRAQLRTYHAIPSLQAHQDASAYKQLQDAPRLKSILKGAAEDRPEPHDLADFKNLKSPRSNPVNLIFLICAQASQVAELHFPSGGEFHDLVMKTNYTSRSRARAFLWLMWQYLESDFTEEGCEENPFGAGVDYELGLANQGVPRMEEMTQEEEARENIDPQDEIDFGHGKQSHRAKIIAADQAYVVDSQTKRGSRTKLLVEDSPSAAILPRIRPSKHESDIDSTRSTPPPKTLSLSRLAINSTVRRGGGSLKYQLFDASSPAGPSTHATEGIVPRKPRPPTAHQLAVERNRSQRVEHILDRGLRRQHHVSRKMRRQEGVLARTKRRLDAMADPFVDSDEEEASPHMSSRSSFRDRGLGGLCQLTMEEDNFGEEPASYAAAVRRANRRLKRWGGRRDLGIIPPSKRRATVQPSDETLPDPIMELERLATPDKARMKKSRANGKTSVNSGVVNTNGDVAMEDADDLDEVDKELLGIDSGAEEPEATAEGKDEDEELDDVDKTLLGLDEDEDTEST
ncbi:putative INO80 chromatin remodeling complex Ies1 [Rosellinia necatrix]|uniref:Putative INO80 chromatin remodeling complex Ies1 n=1 Tax=Rosellinia necatrix TaxID=77044 RepID=A0A1W2THQ3_ROSNE|nr:putative INO80 chromatin remodeling complex Ies1 [Rosellinia necatrix]